MRKIFLLIIIATLGIASCGKKDKVKLIDDKTGKEVTIKVNRFEDVLFDQSQKDLRSHLQKNFEAYKPLFNTSLDNPEYYEMIRSFAQDTVMISTYKQVKQRYPSLDWISEDITSSFARLKEQYPKLLIPKLYSLILGPADFSYAYGSRVITRPDFITFAIDLYSINNFKDNKYYAHFPKYICKMLDSNNIVPDIMLSYIRNVATIETPLSEEKSNASLVEIMIERGKFIYAAQNVLPSYELRSILRYNKEEMDWAVKNEFKIWAYLTQNRLLFEKDRTKYMNFIVEAPSTKGIEGSPARLGEYVGYKIVEKYMDKKGVSLKELLETTDAEKILRESGYKPKK